MTVYSTKEQLEKIAHYLIAYMRIPYFQDDTVPGKIMEKIFLLVHDAELLDTYDYVDVCIKNKVGWQIKSTKDSVKNYFPISIFSNHEMLIFVGVQKVTRVKKGNYL